MENANNRSENLKVSTTTPIKKRLRIPEIFTRADRGLVDAAGASAKRNDRSSPPTQSNVADAVKRLQRKVDDDCRRPTQRGFRKLDHGIGNFGAGDAFAQTKDFAGREIPKMPVKDLVRQYNRSWCHSRPGYYQNSSVKIPEDDNTLFSAFDFFYF